MAKKKSSAYIGTISQEQYDFRRMDWSIFDDGMNIYTNVDLMRARVREYLARYGICFTGTFEFTKAVVDGLDSKVYILYGGDSLTKMFWVADSRLVFYGRRGEMELISSHSGQANILEQWRQRKELFERNEFTRISDSGD